MQFTYDRVEQKVTAKNVRQSNLNLNKIAALNCAKPTITFEGGDAC